MAQLNVEKVDRRYRPTYFDGDRDGRISAVHAACEEAVADVPGKLEPADHLKLFECAYYATGPILEIGHQRGKSTTVLALGAAHAGHAHHITSIDQHEPYGPEARENLRRHGIPDERVTLITGDSATIVDGLAPGFDVVFVDGDHTYEGVSRDLRAVARVLAAGGVVLCHDYYHPANDTGEYGVRTAVDELSAHYSLYFRGRHGGVILLEHSETPDA
jgi:predicted O-methyltransferase YrrM